MTSPNGLAKLVGKNIQNRRKQLGLTQAQLAELIGVGQQGLSRMERGNIEPKFERIQSLATVLQWTPGDFFRDTEKEREWDDMELARRIMSCLRELKEVEKEAVVRLVFDMADMFKKVRSYQP